MASSFPPDRVSIVDTRVIAELRSLDTDGNNVSGELIGIFLRETPMRIDAIRKARERTDVAREAHKIRGSSGTLGFPALALACGLLEDACDGSVIELAPLIASVEQTYEATKEAIIRM